MNVLVILIPVSLLLGLLGLAAFVWTVKTDQYDDDLGNAGRILLDDSPPQPRPTPPKASQRTQGAAHHN